MRPAATLCHRGKLSSRFLYHSTEFAVPMSHVAQTICQGCAWIAAVANPHSGDLVVIPSDHPSGPAFSSAPKLSSAGFGLLAAQPSFATPVPRRRQLTNSDELVPIAASAQTALCGVVGPLPILCQDTRDCILQNSFVMGRIENAASKRATGFERRGISR